MAASFLLHHPIPQASIAQHKDGTSQLRRVPLSRKGKLSQAASFPSFLRHQAKVLLWFHLNQAGKAEMYRDAGTRKKKPGLPIAAMQWE